MALLIDIRKICVSSLTMEFLAPGSMTAAIFSVGLPETCVNDFIAKGY